MRLIVDSSPEVILTEFLEYKGREYMRELTDDEVAHWSKLDWFFLQYHEVGKKKSELLESEYQLLLNKLKKI